MKSNLPHIPARQHIRCGIHSRIPICCILWYIFIWMPLLFGKTNEGWKWRYMNSQEGNRKYIGCPLCRLIGRVVKTKKCSCKGSIWRNKQRRVE